MAKKKDNSLLWLLLLGGAGAYAFMASKAQAAQTTDPSTAPSNSLDQAAASINTATAQAAAYNPNPLGIPYTGPTQIVHVLNSAGQITGEAPYAQALLIAAQEGGSIAP